MMIFHIKEGRARPNNYFRKEMWTLIRQVCKRRHILTLQTGCFLCLMFTCLMLLSREYDPGNVISIHSKCKLLMNQVRYNQTIGIEQVGGHIKVDNLSKSHSINNVEKNNTKIEIKADQVAKELPNKPEPVLRLAEDRTVFDSPEFKQYVKPRSYRINAHDYRFLLTGSGICLGEAPTLMIMVLSEYYHVEERQTIRNTYGSVVKTHAWPRLNTKLNVKIAFIFGSPGESTAKLTIAAEEDRKHGDVVMVDFKDSYNNLTTKVLMSMKWVTTFCPRAKFMLKVDEDTFVHLGNLVTFLNGVVVPDNGIVIGHGVYRSPVLRTGRWGVSELTYPFPEYPSYSSGNTYVISGNCLGRMFYTAEYLPFIIIEDAFLTGIVREAIGAVHLHKVGFTWWEERAPRLCGFHNNVRISGTNCDIELMKKLWEAVHVKNMANCYDPSKFEKPVYV